MPQSIHSVEEFLAHALAIEREAAERYREFEAYFRDRGEEVLAGLCGNLARLEEEHFQLLLRQSRDRELPAIEAGRYQWLESGAPEAAARELFYRITNPRHLLEIALHGERQAQRFFEWVALTTPDAAVGALAREMAGEEEEHVAWVEQALAYTPSTLIDWERLFKPGRRRA
jgi:rubrerythrin